MPIGVIAAGVTAVGAIGGALISSSSSSNAANQANQSQQQATQAQLQLGRENMAQQQAIYNSNYNTLSPFVSRGNVAGQDINALLGLPAAPAMTSPLAGSTSSAPGMGGGGGGGAGGGIGGALGGGMGVRPVNVQMARPADAVGAKNGIQTATGGPLAGLDRSSRIGGLVGVLTGAPNPFNRPPVMAPGPATPPMPPSAPGTTPTPAPGTTQPSAMDAFNTFANSAGMQFQQQQAANGLNNLYAGHSQLQSGAAMKAIPAYLQQEALNNYFMPYMGLLGGQQATGAQAGSAIAGVGSNFGNTAGNIYNGMGNAIQSGADAASNAALIRGQNSNNMWNGIGGALGTLGSSFVNSGMFGGGGGQTAANNPWIAASDRRLKTNIVKLGEYPDGLGIYEWNWKSAPDGEKIKGVIADEVKELRPWAYVANFSDGYDGVNYGALEAVNGR